MTHAEFYKESAPLLKRLEEMVGYAYIYPDSITLDGGVERQRLPEFITIITAIGTLQDKVELS